MTRKCYCRTVGRKFCPVHHPRHEGKVGAVKATPFNTPHQINTIVSGTRIHTKSHSNQPNVTAFTHKDMHWTLEEINNMEQEELWAALILLRIPDKHPTNINPQIKKVDMIRHLKAYLEIYSDTAMEKYYSEYPFMRGLVKK